MIQVSKRPIYEILEDLPQDFKILDVGGASAPFKRANYLIDIVPFESINLEQVKGTGDIKFTKETYVSHDICSREPFPFKDKEFDFSICSHVLEDVRDPIWVCSEIIRVSKAGYIEVPSRLYETAFDLEIKGLAGASHHRWLVDLDNDKKLRFTFKYMQVHSKVVNKNKTVYKKNNKDMYLCLEWQDSFFFYENWLNSGKEIFEYYLSKPLNGKETWNIYRKTGTRVFFKEWLSYLKNTSPFFKRIYARVQSKKN